MLHNIDVEFEIPMKLVRLTKMCLRETYNKGRKDKHFSDSFPLQSGKKQGNVLTLHF
jgi:hypothetical protein